MPKPGFKAITISDGTSAKLDAFGDKTNHRGYDEIICELLRRVEEDNQ